MSAWFPCFLLILFYQVWVLHRMYSSSEATENCIQIIASQDSRWRHTHARTCFVIILWHEAQYWYIYERHLWRSAEWERLLCGVKIWQALVYFSMRPIKYSLWFIHTSMEGDISKQSSPGEMSHVFGIGKASFIKRIILYDLFSTSSSWKDMLLRFFVQLCEFFMNLTSPLWFLNCFLWCYGAVFQFVYVTHCFHRYLNIRNECYDHYYYNYNSCSWCCCLHSVIYFPVHVQVF